MKFKKLIGRVNNSSFISLIIEDGDRSNGIGDQVWISNDGTEMEVYEGANKDVVTEAMNLFEGNSKSAFRGALMRMGIYF